MALMVVSKQFKERNPNLFQMMIDKYGEFKPVEETEAKIIFRFNAPGTEENTYYNQWFNESELGVYDMGALIEDNIEQRDEENETQWIADINRRIKYQKEIGNNVGAISDGYHTFDELYAHRIALFRALCCFLHYNGVTPAPYAWKAKKHYGGAEFDGWFLAGIGSEPGKQITYHISMQEWDTWPGNEFEQSPYEWDGHTSADVLERLRRL